MLDLKQFINQTLSLPLSSHKNMVGGLILGLSVLTASRGERLELSSREQEIPFPLKCRQDMLKVKSEVKLLTLRSPAMMRGISTKGF